jgi:pentapeptide MXKDX repeat protein
MTRRLLQSTLAAAFLGGVVALGAAADDAKKEGDKKPEMKKEGDKKGAEKKDGEKKDTEKKDAEKKESAGPPAKAADWSKFPKYDTPASGEVVKITETTITLRNQVPMRNGNRTEMKNVDVEYTWHENGLARREKPPKFFNDKGLERPAKPEELDKLRKPLGVPGFHIDRSELKTGDLVRLELVRPQAIPASKAKPEDLSIKYAIMTGEHPKPSKPLETEKKKK